VDTTGIWTAKPELKMHELHCIRGNLVHFLRNISLFQGCFYVLWRCHHTNWICLSNWPLHSMC